MLKLLHTFVGRIAVFVEAGEACLGKVESVDSSDEQVRARFNIVPGSFCCRLRVIRQPGDDPIEEVLQQPPFGDSWDVLVSNEEFDLTDEHWSALFHWGGGFRVYFQAAFVERFAAGDVGWLYEFYNDDDDDLESN